MEFSASACARVKEQVKGRVLTNARITREIEKQIASYRTWYASKRRLKQKPLAVMAEGDSWSRYIVGKAVIFYLEAKLGIEILNLAKPGDEVSEMLTGEQLARLTRELKRGPAPRQKYDFLLFSGGGNDLLGQERFYKWLNDYQPGMPPSDLVNDAALNVALAAIKLRYQELIALRDKESPPTTLLFHGYDFAIPTGKGVCGLGPWLLPGLKMRHIPAALQTAVVKEFLKRFDLLLTGIAAGAKNVHIVPTQGTLRADEWANELHPTDPGFAKIADKFIPLMRA